MKLHIRTMKIWSGMALIFCAVGMSSSVLAVDKDVDLKIENNQLVITSGKMANGCSLFSSKEKGCIKVKKDKKATLKFQLNGNTECSLPKGERWELSAFYLGGYNADEKPDSSGFTNTADADYYKVEQDFEMLDRASGKVNSVLSSNNLKLNVSNENQSEYIVWYRVEAACFTDGGAVIETIYSDPRVRNDGTTPE